VQLIQRIHYYVNLCNLKYEHLNERRNLRNTHDRSEISQLCLIFDKLPATTNDPLEIGIFFEDVL
jgi:hypothetical protein